MSTQRNPQAAPAMVLAQLLSENPELPALNWSISPDGHLSGSNMQMTEDPRPAMPAFVAVLGGQFSEHTTKAEPAVFSVWMHVVWRDVELSVWMGCPAEVLASQVTAVAA